MRIITYICSLLSLCMILSCHRVGSSGRRAHRSEVPGAIELPKITKAEQVIKHIGYTTSYNSETLNPNWVAYELTDVELQGKLKGKETFCWDPEVLGRKSRREDYRNDDNWDKGHMAPKADMKWSVQAYEESFYLSNICPQNHDLNSGAWLKTENLARRYAKKYGKVYIVCGPIFNKREYGSLGHNNVWIPDAFFKAILVPLNGKYEAISFVMANSSQNNSLSTYSMSVDDLELLIKRDLFFYLDSREQDQTECKVNLKFWGLQ